MSKYNSNSLFALVHAMNQSEKRHFRMESGDSSSVYMQLFDAVAKQENWDEPALKAQFEGQASLRQFSTLKHYLRNRILKSLRNYSEGISPQAKVLDIVRNVEVLYRKGLYSLCQSELKRARKRVETYDMDVLGLAVLEWERKLLQIQAPGAKTVLEPLTQAQMRQTQRYLRKTQLFAANLRPGKQTQLPGLTADSDLHERTLHALYHYQKAVMSGKSSEGIELLREILEEWKTQPQLRSCYLETYVSLSLSLVAIYIFTKDTQTGLQLLQNIRTEFSTLKKASAPLLRAAFRAYNLELEIYRDQADLPKGLALAQEIEDILETHSQLVPAEYSYSFGYQFAYLHFLNGDFPRTLSWVNRLLNANREDARVDLRTYAHWLNLIVHFELNNPFVLRYGIDGMQRFLKKRRRVRNYEKLLLRLLRKGMEVQGKSRRLLFTQTLKKLEEEEIPGAALDYLDFFSWIRRHCQ